MTSSTDGLASAGNVADRTRLVVPKIHESVWASSRSATKSVVASRAGSVNERAASVVASTSQSVAVKRPQVAAANKNASAVAGLNSSAVVAPKIQHHRQEAARKTAATAKSVDAIVRPVSRTAKTIQPLAQKQSMATGGLTKSANHTSAVAASTSSVSQLSEADRAAIMARAARIREQASRQAEARAKADALAAIQQQSVAAAIKSASTTAKAANLVQHSASVFAPAAVNPVVSAASTPAVSASSKKTGKLADRFKRSSAKKSTKTEAKQTKRAVKSSETKVATSQHKAASTAKQAKMAGVFAASTSKTAELPTTRNLDAVSQGGAVAVAQPNLFERMASAKITISFKFNKQRFLTVLRYLAVAVIIATSGYLAWDTYKTNMSVKSTFGGGDSSTASALSIAGANPATADQTAVSREDKAAYTVPSDQPRYIYIPAINVYARVMSVGVNSKGNIDTPANLNDTAWYDGSAKPGQEGQVFIDGHNSFSNTVNASFNRLGELKQGDLITVERGDGQKINYRVSEVETVNVNDVDMGKALNPPAGATKGITLMTCAGKFDYRSQTADQRLIVYAVHE